PTSHARSRLALQRSLVSSHPCDSSCYLPCFPPHPHLHSFPTRRSSDLQPHPRIRRRRNGRAHFRSARRARLGAGENFSRSGADRDRKSTRLNSSHVAISYAVFCLKKKKESSTDTSEKACVHISHTICRV